MNASTLPIGGVVQFYYIMFVAFCITAGETTVDSKSEK